MLTWSLKNRKRKQHLWRDVWKPWRDMLDRGRFTWIKAGKAAGVKTEEDEIGCGERHFSKDNREINWTRYNRMQLMNRKWQHTDRTGTVRGLKKTCKETSSQHLLLFLHSSEWRTRTCSDFTESVTVVFRLSHDSSNQLDYKAHSIWHDERPFK